MRKPTPLAKAFSGRRTDWTELSDAQLLAQCEVDTYRASGPGGQKRNKTSSAVRLRHPASGLIVIAEESRSQHENRLRALRRLRQAFYLEIREELPRDGLGQAGPPSQISILAAIRDGNGRIKLGRKDSRFWPLAGLLLDALQATAARLSEAAAILGISTGNLADLLYADPKLWQQANRLRNQFGQKPLVG